MALLLSPTQKQLQLCYVRIAALTIAHRPTVKLERWNKGLKDKVLGEKVYSGYRRTIVFVRVLWILSCP
jgi:hypothetical protein